MIAQNIFGETFSKPISFSTTDGKFIELKNWVIGIPDRPNKIQCVGSSDTEVHMAWHDTVDRHKLQQQRMEEFLRPNFNIEYRMA